MCIKKQLNYYITYNITILYYITFNKVTVKKKKKAS